MKAHVIRKIRGRVHLVDGDSLVLSRGSRLCVSRDGGRTVTAGPALAGTARDRLADLSRLATRLLRGGIHHVVPVDSKHLLVLAGRILRRVDRMSLRPVGPGERVVGSRPLNFCRTRAGTILYGEYRGNPERAPIRVMASEDGGLTWHVAHRFEGVRHVHGIFQDPHDDAVWITTGDEDHECAIWRTAGGFDDLRPVWSGSQQARAIPLLFGDDAVFFGSDTPLEPNHLFAMPRNGGPPRPVASVGGSVFHGVRNGDRLFFSTACEPSQVNMARRAEIWCAHRDSPDRWFMIHTSAKDPWPMKLFQYGQAYLATGQPSDGTIWISPLAAANDQYSLLLACERSEASQEGEDLQ